MPTLKDTKRHRFDPMTHVIVDTVAEVTATLKLQLEAERRHADKLANELKQLLKAPGNRRALAEDALIVHREHRAANPA